MKKILAIILTVIIICSFTACTKSEDIKPISYETCTVDVSKVVDNKMLFENRMVSTKEQKLFKDIILNVINMAENTEIEDFEIAFSEEVFTSWEECNNYAEAVKVGKTHLGSEVHYYLWLAQRIINEEAKWEEICDENKVITTIAFSAKEGWIGSCTKKCLMGYIDEATEGYVHGNNNHAFSAHEKWQAFIVEIV